MVKSFFKYLLTTPTNLLEAVQIALPRESQSKYTRLTGVSWQFPLT